MIDLILPTIRGGIDLLSRRESAGDIERELNAQFHGNQYSISNYEGDEVEFTVESIHARAKFSPKKIGEGIDIVEGDNLFTNLEREREEPTVKEKLRANYTEKWITVLRLNIDTGDADVVRPPGLHLGYITAKTSICYDGYSETSPSKTPISPIRIGETHDIQSDKMEIKIQYNGSVGDYADRISDSIDLLTEIQNNMEYYTTMYLLDFHDSGKQFNGDEFRWPDEERATNLAEYLFDDSIDLTELEQYATQTKQKFTSSE